MERCSLFALRYAAPIIVNQINEKRANSSVQVKEVPKRYLENTWNNTSKTKRAKITIINHSKNLFILLKTTSDFLIIIDF